MRSLLFLAFSLFCLLQLGCGNRPDSQVTTTEMEYITVIDLQEQQRVIPVDDFVDRRTGLAAVKRVRVIDRKTGKTTWVSAEDVLSEPPATARYIPILQVEAIDD